MILTLGVVVSKVSKIVTPTCKSYQYVFIELLCNLLNVVLIILAFWTVSFMVVC
jgi:hypothetical protein